MDRKIRVGAVSYLNTKPLVWGFEQGGLKEEIDLSFEYPALLADQLRKNEIDIGLIPVAAMPGIPSAKIISDFCIGANGAVASVCLFSKVPLQEIETILLDYQSRTSVALLKVLLKEHWKMTPKLQDTSADYENGVEGSTAALIIGDRAFPQRHLHPYIYDLAEEWKVMTGLPFVFAAWVANKELPIEFIQKFNVVAGSGMKHLQEIVAENISADYDLMKYYTENIDYDLTEEKRKALSLFLELKAHIA